MNIRYVSSMTATTITPLTTGHVSITNAMRRSQGTGLGRRLAMFTDHNLTSPLPIHAWAIEAGDELLLVDTGEVAEARDQRFARFAVSREDEIDNALRGAGYGPADLTRVVLTHLHGDHMDGLARLGEVELLVAADELRAAGALGARLTRRIVRQPLPAPFSPTPFVFDGPPVGAFPRSRPLSADGTVLAVPAPGHTPGHIAVLVDRGEHHVLLCGDAAYDQQQIVDRHPDAVSPRPEIARATMETILRHARLHPTVVLPSHDPESAARLAEVQVLAAPEPVTVS
jgi:glyoxylase-like metal-dependent hydrolase (beta-lactamase superfamily II)